MSCPNWPLIAAHRAIHSGEETEGYREALTHLETCKACWSDALAADPSLLFRRLPVPALESEEAEILAVQQAVAAMRTASRLEGLQTSPRRRGRSWKEWAAAAVLVATVGGAGSWYGLASRPVEMGPESLGVPALTFDALATPAFAVPAASARRIEGIEGSDSEVREYGGETRDDVAVTWILVKDLEV